MLAAQSRGRAPALGRAQAEAAVAWLRRVQAVRPSAVPWPTACPVFCRRIGTSRTGQEEDEGLQGQGEDEGEQGEEDEG